MDRLTEYIDDSPGIDTRKLQFYCDVGGYIIGDIARRLSAYEDTGMEPEEVRSLRIDMAIIKAMFGDADVKRMKELCEADKERRVVVLPEDGMLYHFEEIPETGERWVGNKPIQKITFTCGFGLVGMPFDFSQLGRTFFLTRAEAESALEGGVQP